MVLEIYVFPHPPRGGLCSSNECGQHFFSEARGSYRPFPSPWSLILDSLSPSPCSGSKTEPHLGHRKRVYLVNAEANIIQEIQAGKSAVTELRKPSGLIQSHTGEGTRLWAHWECLQPFSTIRTSSVERREYKPGAGPRGGDHRGPGDH